MKPLLHWNEAVEPKVVPGLKRTTPLVGAGIVPQSIAARGNMNN